MLGVVERERKGVDMPGWKDGRRVSIREGRAAVVEEGWVDCAGWDNDGVGRLASLVEASRGSSSASSEDSSSS